MQDIHIFLLVVSLRSSLSLKLKYRGNNGVNKIKHTNVTTVSIKLKIRNNYLRHAHCCKNQVNNILNNYVHLLQLFLQLGSMYPGFRVHSPLEAQLEHIELLSVHPK